MRLHSLSLFVVLHTVSNSSRYGNVETVVDLDLLRAMPAALVRSVNNDLLDKLMHDLRCQICDMLILLHHADECGHIGGLLFGSFDIGSKARSSSMTGSSERSCIRST